MAGPGVGGEVNLVKSVRSPTLPHLFCTAHRWLPVTIVGRNHPTTIVGSHHARRARPSNSESAQLKHSASAPSQPSQSATGACVRACTAISPALSLRSLGCAIRKVCRNYCMPRRTNERYCNHDVWMAHIQTHPHAPLKLRTIRNGNDFACIDVTKLDCAECAYYLITIDRSTLGTSETRLFKRTCLIS